MRVRLLDILIQARRRVSSERGFAVPTVMLMMVAAMGVASVGVMTSVQGQSGTVRDQGGKAALATAESGVSQALLHYNRGVPPCAPASAGEWCGPVTGMTVDGGAVSYWARLAEGETECGVGNEVECVEVVSTGTFNGVTRRVQVMAASVPTEGSGGGGPFASASVLSKETITLDSNAIIHTGTSTDGAFDLNSKAQQCGPASVGIGDDMETESNAKWMENTDCSEPELDPESVPEAQLTLPAVNQGDAPTNNDNARFFDEDPISGNKQHACWNGVDGNGNPATSDCGERELLVNSNSSVTLGGSVYSFCSLTLKSNSSLQIAAGASVTIYFDSPENCNYSSPAMQLDMDSNTEITSATGEPTSLAMLFVGSESIETRILMNSNTEVDGSCAQTFVIYAPLSEIELNSNSKFCGAIAGNSVHLDSNAEIWSATGTESFELPEVDLPDTPDHYEPYRFVECGAAPASPPDAGC